VAKRLFDIVVAALVLVATLPLTAASALAVRLGSPGPIFYRAARAGVGGRPFAMLKFRTMHVADRQGPEITAPGDARIFAAGVWLRRLKLDELPQFWNVLTGDMSIVGPRPESLAIVDAHYAPWMRETLAVRPGITSPGAIFGYTHADALLDPADPEGSYVRHVLGPKLAIERAYLDRATFVADIAVMLRTGWTILLVAAGRTRFALPFDAQAAARWHPVPGA
jgi:lipopolysaccharide/colanic/teichoic acid biosynthesis glycosyltransferase